MDYAQKRRYSRVASLASYVGLLGYLTITEFIDPVEGANPLLFSSIKAVPLLAFAPGLIRQNRRSLAWLCFVLLIYFIFTIAMWQSHSLVTVSLIVALFVSAMMHIRWHNRALNGIPEKKRKKKKATS